MRCPARSLGSRRTRGWSGCALALGCALLMLSAMLATSGYALASGAGGALTFTPQSGPVGTQVTVTVTISAALPDPTPYLLSATPNDPAAHGCGDGVGLPDAPKFIVIPGQPTTTTITWPAALDSGAYFLCAAPTSDQKGPGVWSQQPFAVTSGVPAPPGIVAEVAGGVVVSGASFTLTVDTTALDGETPEHLTLVQLGQPGARQLKWTQHSQVGTLYTFDVTVPTDTPPGTYAVQVLSAGGLAATSNTFRVAASALVSHPGPRTTAPLQALRAASPAGVLLVAVIALLLALAVAGLVKPHVRGRRRDARSP